jgi:hypothetical protein
MILGKCNISRSILAMVARSFFPVDQLKSSSGWEMRRRSKGQTWQKETPRMADSLAPIKIVGIKARLPCNHDAFGDLWDDATN